MTTVRHLGRFRGADADRTIDARRTADLAEKVEIARFDGPHFTAEREGDSLVIYCIGDDTGVAGVNVIGTVDRPPKNMKELQRVYDEAFKSRLKTHEQQADKHSATQALAGLAGR
jgi:hypothetical protein